MKTTGRGARKPTRKPVGKTTRKPARRNPTLKHHVALTEFLRRKATGTGKVLSDLDRYRLDRAVLAVARDVYERVAEAGLEESDVLYYALTDAARALRGEDISTPLYQWGSTLFAKATEVEQQIQRENKEAGRMLPGVAPKDRAHYEKAGLLWNAPHRLDAWKNALYTGAWLCELQAARKPPGQYAIILGLAEQTLEALGEPTAAADARVASIFRASLKAPGPVYRVPGSSRTNPQRARVTRKNTARRRTSRR